MATQSEQLASAIAAITQLNQTFTAEVAQWQQQRTSMQSLLNQAVAAVPNLSKTYYVDAVNGNDLNQGTQAHPLATLTKVIDLVGALRAGIATIYLSPGVYDWAQFNKNIYCHLQIFGERDKSTQTIINAPEGVTCLSVFNGSTVRLNDLTVHRFGDGGSEHTPFALLYSGASLACGSYRTNDTPSSAVNSFKYSFIKSPLVKTERGWGFFSLERSFAECSNLNPTPLYTSRNQLLINITNSVLSNITTPTITLQSTRAGVL